MQVPYSKFLAVPARSRPQEREPSPAGSQGSINATPQSDLGRQSYRLSFRQHGKIDPTSPSRTSAACVVEAPATEQTDCYEKSVVRARFGSA